MLYRGSCVYLYMFYMFCIGLQNTNLEVWTVVKLRTIQNTNLEVWTVVKLRTIVTTSATDTSYRKTHPHYPEWCSVMSQAKPGLLCPSLNDNSAIYQQSKQSLSQCCYPSASLQYSLSASGILYAYTAAEEGGGGGVALSPNVTRFLSWSTWNSCPVTVRLGVEVELNRRLKTTMAAERVVIDWQQTNWIPEHGEQSSSCQGTGPWLIITASRLFLYKAWIFWCCKPFRRNLSILNKRNGQKQKCRIAMANTLHIPRTHKL